MLKSFVAYAQNNATVTEVDDYSQHIYFVIERQWVLRLIACT